MRLPVSIAQLVTDKHIGGRGIRHTQIGFRQRQQSHTFLGVEAIFLQEAVDPAGRLRGAQIIQD